VRCVGAGAEDAPGQRREHRQEAIGRANRRALPSSASSIETCSWLAMVELIARSSTGRPSSLATAGATTLPPAPYPAEMVTPGI